MRHLENSRFKWMVSRSPSTFPLVFLRQGQCTETSVFDVATVRHKFPVVITGLASDVQEGVQHETCNWYDMLRVTYVGIV